MQKLIITALSLLTVIFLSCGDEEENPLKPEPEKKELKLISFRPDTALAGEELYIKCENILDGSAEVILPEDVAAPILSIDSSSGKYEINVKCPTKQKQEK